MQRSARSMCRSQRRSGHFHPHPYFRIQGNLTHGRERSIAAVTTSAGAFGIATPLDARASLP